MIPHTVFHTPQRRSRRRTLLPTAARQLLQDWRRAVTPDRNISFCTAAVVAMAFPIGCALANEGEALPDTTPPDLAVCSPDDSQFGRFRAGDRISLTEYERIDPDPNDRQAVASAYPSYRLRAEVSGDFDVAEDGTIAVPILGQFTAAGKTVGELRDAVAAAFESTLGHAGVITIAVTEHQPIYVDGLVKNPGAYKYTPGLTALHAVSLAGGYQDIKLESHQVLLSTLQEVQGGEQTKASLERLLAREAVLRAELDATSLSAPPTALIDLAGESRANELMANQVAERKTLAETKMLEQQRQAQLIDNAKQVLDERAVQIDMVNAAVEERSGRMKKLKAMMSKGVSNETFYQTAQTEYLDSLARKQDVIAAVQQVQAQLSDAQMALGKLKLDARYALQHEISDLELQIAQQSMVYRSHLTATRIFDADPNASLGGSPLTYEVVRRTAGRVATYRVKGSCPLQPGDLVRVFLENGKGSAEAMYGHPGPADRADDPGGGGPKMDRARLDIYAEPAADRVADAADQGAPVPRLRPLKILPQGSRSMPTVNVGVRGNLKPLSSCSTWLAQVRNVPIGLSDLKAHCPGFNVSRL
jgi:exopolysaccharide production protein ExoF